MTPKTIAFQGNLGAYSHLSCQAVYPDLEVVPCPSFDAVFDTAERGNADLAMVPVENSVAGRVTDIHRLLPQRGLHIIGEHYQPVRHQLLAPPGVSLSDLEVVYSHPQALAQCRQWLKDHGLSPQAATDTAGAARKISEERPTNAAAIASAIAGEIYGLTPLARDIQDVRGNTTRFVILSQHPNIHFDAETRWVTSCLFRIRNLPAALYKALGGFATNGVNLLKLESYQLAGFTWTQFAIDFEGTPEDAPIARALEEMLFFSTELRILGTYPAHPDRKGL